MIAGIDGWQGAAIDRLNLKTEPFLTGSVFEGQRASAQIRNRHIANKRFVNHIKRSFQGDIHLHLSVGRRRQRQDKQQGQRKADQRRHLPSIVAMLPVVCKSPQIDVHRNRRLVAIQLTKTSLPDSKLSGRAGERFVRALRHFVVLRVGESDAVLKPSASSASRSIKRRTRRDTL